MSSTAESSSFPVMLFSVPTDSGFKHDDVSDLTPDFADGSVLACVYRGGLVSSHNLHFSYLQITAQRAENVFRSRTEMETWYSGNSLQVGKAAWGLPVVTDQNQWGILLCEGNCEQTPKSVCWWTSWQAYFLPLAAPSVSVISLPFSSHS